MDRVVEASVLDLIVLRVSLAVETGLELTLRSGILQVVRPNLISNASSLVSLIVVPLRLNSQSFTSLRPLRLFVILLVIVASAI